MRRQSHLSEFIIVLVNLVEAFHHESRWPQDATSVERIKQICGDPGTWHGLHMHRYHRFIYNTQVQLSELNSWACEHQAADGLDVLRRGFLRDAAYQEVPKLQTPSVSDRKPPPDPWKSPVGETVLVFLTRKTHTKINNIVTAINKMSFWKQVKEYKISNSFPLMLMKKIANWTSRICLGKFFFFLINCVYTLSNKNIIF